jgi:ketosteroid isomerase-like protein
MEWLLGAAPIAATALMVPASTQSPSARHVVEQITATYAADGDQQDAGGIAELFIKDGMLIAPSAAGAVTAGPQAIAQNYANFFKKGADHMTVTLDWVASIADKVIIVYGDEFESLRDP